MVLLSTILYVFAINYHIFGKWSNKCIPEYLVLVGSLLVFGAWLTQHSLASWYTLAMTREEYKSVLQSKGFTLLKTQKGYPARGEEDVYTRPDFKCNFYISHVSKDDKTKYGLLTGKTIGKQLENVCPPNVEDSFAPEKGYYVWADDAFVDLMKNLPSSYLTQ